MRLLLIAASLACLGFVFPYRLNHGRGLPARRGPQLLHGGSATNSGSPLSRSLRLASEGAVVTAKAPTSILYRFSPWLVAGQAGIDAMLFGQTLLTHTRLPFYLCLFTVYELLSGAEKRNRLDGSTFKILGLSSALSVLWLLYSVGLSPPPMLLAVQSLLATRKYGLSLPKVGSLRELTKDPLPSLYLASMVPAYRAARPEMAPVIPVLLGSLLALHGAALVGPKRLASDTYKKLNAMLVMFFAGAAVSCRAPFRVVYALPMMIGLLRGFLPFAESGGIAAATKIKTTTNE